MRLGPPILPTFSFGNSRREKSPLDERHYSSCWKNSFIHEGMYFIKILYSIFWFTSLSLLLSLRRGLHLWMCCFHVSSILTSKSIRHINPWFPSPFDFKWGQVRIVESGKSARDILAAIPIFSGDRCACQHLGYTKWPCWFCCKYWRSYTLQKTLLLCLLSFCLRVVTHYGVFFPQRPRKEV